MKNELPFLDPEDNDRLFYLSKHIADQCFSDSGTVVLSNESSNQSVFSMLDLSTPMNIFTTDEDSPMKKHLRHKNVFKLNEEIVRNLTEPARSVMVIVQADTNITKLLDEFRSSIWWRHDAPYLLIDGSENRSCARANEVLTELWTFKILNAIFLCTKPANRPRILTLNPYGSIFPNSWKALGKLNSEQQNVTLLQYNLRTSDALFEGIGSTFCKSLYFDKLKDVQGYSFKTSYMYPANILEEYDETKTGYERCSGTGAKPQCFVLNYINATLTAKRIKKSAFVNEDGNPDGALLDISTETIDSLFAAYYIRDYWRIQSYPFHAGEVKIVTYRKSMQIYDILTSSLNHRTSVTILSLYVFLLIVLKYSLNVSGSSLVMEYFRVLVGAATVTQPKRLAPRLVLIFLISAMAIVTTSFQGYLSALTTSSQNMPVVDSLADLIESKLIPTGRFSYKDMISSQYKKDRYSVMEDYHECLTLMLDDAPIACIVQNELIPPKFDNDPRVHVSQNNFLERSITYTFSDDSPLLNKVNGKEVVRSHDCESSVASVTVKATKHIDSEERNMDFLDIFLKIHAISFSLAIENLFMEKEHPLLDPKENDRLFHLFKHIADQCFIKSGTVVLSNKSLNQSESSMLDLSMPMNIFRAGKDSPMRKHLRHKNVFKLNDEIVRNLTEPARSVMVIVQADTNITKLLDEFRSSIWWRHDAPYLLIDGSEDESCARAYEVLTELWTFKILNAIFLCLKSANHPRILTLNPYQSTFPHSWKALENVDASKQNVNLLNFRLRNNNTLFQGPTYCKSLYFDKLKDVHGYNFKTNYIHPANILPGYNETRTGYERCSGIGTKPICFVLSYINATFTTKRIKSYAFVNKDGQPDGGLLDISTETVDFFIMPSFIRDYGTIQAYPYYAGEIKIVTRKKSIAFQDLLKSHLYLQTLVIIILLYFVILIILKYSLNTSWSSLMMEYFRVLVGAATVAQPKGSPRRLVFVFLISAMAIVTSCFQCYLSAVTTSPQNVPAVDSETDLIKSKLIPSGLSSYKDMISNTYIKDHYNVINDQTECMKLILNGSSIACIINEMFMSYSFNNDPRVHVSRKNFLERGLTYTFTDDSPLLNKVDQVLLRLREAGFIEYLENLRDHLYYSEDENVEKSFMYENRMVTIFSLCTVWFVSIVVFLIEVVYFHLKKSSSSDNIQALRVVRKRKICPQKRSVHFGRDKIELL
ncbi:hypothetical protein QAD02_011098 [Eretmocerus hayati]|uniref:Uncharacterized protein n=1 Tax=Eretmocerus hayati TaxID=131215 RepID=A0ACC2NYM5_9HYME|nr:hypothetical protein QAD02_011098 [Eretmocerus hayati]